MHSLKTMIIPPMRVAMVMLSVAVLAHAQAPATRSPGSLTIRVEGRELGLSAADVRTLPRHDYRVAGDGSSDSVVVSGVTLWDILQKAGAPPAEASGRQRAVMYVRLTGTDGQNAVLALVEIDPSFSRRPVVVADRRNGQPLDPVEGPWRVIVPDDLRHARWIRGLVSISVVTLSP